MDIDDEDSKARRNLLVVSTAMILVWWLDVSADKVSARFLGLDASGPGFEWRVWLAMTVALFYFALRFHFSKAHVAHVKSLRIDLLRIAEIQLTKWLRLENNLRLRFVWMPTVLGDAFGLFMERAGKSIAQGHGLTEPLPVVRISVPAANYQTVAYTDGSQRMTLQSGSMRVQYFVQGPHGDQPSNEASLGFELRWLRQSIAWVRMWTWATIYSESSTSLLLPSLWAAFAAGLAGFKLASTW
ncbi:MAG: hypothetical protein V4645_09985 [Pseudomonadota bacterium]